MITRPPTAFPRTLRALDADRPPLPVLRGAAALALLGAWIVWAFAARLPVYAVSESARIEPVVRVRPLEAPVAGRVAAVATGLGQDVEAGQLLFLLEPGLLETELEGQEARRGALDSGVAALERELERGREALASGREEAAAEIEEAEALARESDLLASWAEREASRAKRLAGEGLLPTADGERLAAESARRGEVARSHRSAVARLHAKHDSEEAARQARLELLRRERAMLSGEAGAADAELRSLRHRLALHRVEASADGQIGEISVVPGEVVEPGDPLGTLVPDSELGVRAEFPASDVGRLAPGQKGRIRLDSYPHLQPLPLRVVEVGSEARSGTVQVTLEIELPAAEVPLQHGLPGAVDVVTETVSPAALLVRSAHGRLQLARRLDADRSP